jgi:hypothetical protein
MSGSNYELPKTAPLNVSTDKTNPKTANAKPDPVWKPGQNPLTVERPFMLRRVSPLEAAVCCVALGPAILLKPEAVYWIIIGLLLPLNTLAMALPSNRFRLNSLSGLRSLLLILLVVPLEVMLVALALEKSGLKAGLAVADICFILVIHLSAMLYLMGRARLDRKLIRRWGVQVAFLFPIPWIFLYLLSLLDSVLAKLTLDANLRGLLFDSGIFRLFLLIICLGVFQLIQRRLAQSGKLKYNSEKAPQVLSTRQKVHRARSYHDHSDSSSTGGGGL